jgi:dipeptidase
MGVSTCDTLIAIPTVSADGVALLVKDSDRDPNEAQQVVVLPPVEHAPGRRRCTCVGIDKTPLHAKQIAFDFLDQDR